MFSKIILIRKIYSVIMAILVEIQVRITARLLSYLIASLAQFTYGDYSFIF